MGTYIDASDYVSFMLVSDNTDTGNLTLHAIVQDHQVCEAYHQVFVTVIRTLLLRS